MNQLEQYEMALFNINNQGSDHLLHLKIIKNGQLAGTEMKLLLIKLS